MPTLYLFFQRNYIFLNFNFKFPDIQLFKKIYNFNFFKIRYFPELSNEFSPMIIRKFFENFIVLLGKFNFCNNCSFFKVITVNYYKHVTKKY